MSSNISLDSTSSSSSSSSTTDSSSNSTSSTTSYYYKQPYPIYRQEPTTDAQWQAALDYYETVSFPPTDQYKSLRILQDELNDLQQQANDQKQKDIDDGTDYYKDPVYIDLVNQMHDVAKQMSSLMDSIANANLANNQLVSMQISNEAKLQGMTAATLLAQGEMQANAILAQAEKDNTNASRQTLNANQSTILTSSINEKIREDVINDDILNKKNLSSETQKNLISQSSPSNKNQAIADLVDDLKNNNLPNNHFTNNPV